MDGCMAGAIRLPLLLAATLLGAALLLLAGPGVAPASATCKNARTPAYEIPAKKARKATLCLINKQRAKRGMRKLRQHKAQLKAAKRHTKQMLKKSCFSHLCPGEGDLVDRVSRTSYLPCNCSWGIGENLAYGYGKQSSPKRIVKSWMKSSGHKQNILNRRFEDIGIGIKTGSPGGGRAAATYTTTFGFRD
jgi:uncharacterized protein YkwD